MVMGMGRGVRFALGHRYVSRGFYRCDTCIFVILALIRSYQNVSIMGIRISRIITHLHINEMNKSQKRPFSSFGSIFEKKKLKSYDMAGKYKGSGCCGVHEAERRVIIYDRVIINEYSKRIRS